MFSAILTCRIKDNGDSNLPGLLRSIRERSDAFQNFEVLIKFDSDDYNVPAMVRTFPNYPFRINHIVDRRGRGANDMHLGYTSLLNIAEANTEFFVTLSDDFEVRPLWDKNLLDVLVTRGENNTPFEKHILETLDGREDIFIIQYMPHPGATPQQKINYQMEAKNIENLTGLEVAPGFSRKLIELCGGFGHVSFTDAWSILLQYELLNTHSLNITKFTNDEYAQRMIQGTGMDVMEQANRDGQRKYNFQLINKPWYQRMVKTQAQIVADYYHKHRKPILEANWVNKTQTINFEHKVERRGEIITHN